MAESVPSVLESEARGEIAEIYADNHDRMVRLRQAKDQAEAELRQAKEVAEVPPKASLAVAVKL